MWRGPLRAAVRSFELTLGASNNPAIDDTSERMEVCDLSVFTGKFV